MAISEQCEQEKTTENEFDFILKLKKVSIVELEKTISEAVSRLIGERYSCGIKSINFSIPNGASLELDLSMYINYNLLSSK